LGKRSRTEYSCNPSGRPRAFAISQGALFPTAAHAAEAEAVFKKVLLEIRGMRQSLAEVLVEKNSLSTQNLENQGPENFLAF
jgi:hypothetical protein